MRVREWARRGLRTALAAGMAGGLGGLGSLGGLPGLSWLEAGAAVAAAGSCPGWTGGEPATPGPAPADTAVGVISACDVWVAEPASLEHWTGGSGWASFTLPAGFTVNSIAGVSANDVWAVGFAVSGSSQSAALVLHWDGTGWTRRQSPSPGTDDLLASVRAVSANDVWAVGFTGPSAGSLQGLIEHWDGTSWTQRTAPVIPQGSRLRSVTAVSGSVAWAAGDQAVNGQLRALIESWNGQSWSLVTGLPDPSGAGDSSSIRAVSASSATDAWAVGATTGPDGGSLILHWNGQGWSRVHSPNPVPGASNRLTSVVALSASNAWAFGNGADAPFALHWDGSQWTQTIMPAGLASVGDASAAGDASGAGGDVWLTGTDPGAGNNGGVPLAQAQIAVNANAALGLSGWVTKSVPAANLAPGTNPAVAVAPDGSWEAAWQASSGLLWTLDSAGKQVNTQQKVTAGTSPAAVALPRSGFEVVFSNAADGTLWAVGPGGQAQKAGTGPAVAAGTSPALALDGRTFEAAYHAAGTDHLWTVDVSGTARDTGAVMAAGASPAIAGVPGGGFQLVYAAAGGKLTGIGPDGSSRVLGTGPAVAAGSSPAAAWSGSRAGGFEAVYQATGTGELFSVDPSGASHDLGVAAAAQTSPAVAALVSGAFEVAYQATAGREMFTLTGAGPARDAGFAMGVHDSPVMAALPPTIAGTTTVPDVHGLSDSAAQAALTAAGLTRGSVTADNSCQADAGIVTSQSPAARQQASLGDPVSLGESTGKTPQGGPCHPVVPNLFGFDHASAQRAITAQGLVVGSVETGSNCAVSKGDVYSQDPGANTPAQPGQAVNIVESNGLDQHNKPCIIL